MCGAIKGENLKIRFTFDSRNLDAFWGEKKTPESKATEKNANVV